MNDQMMSIQTASQSPEEKIRNAIALLGKEKRTTREMRSMIFGLEAVIQSMPGAMTADDFDTKHHFSPGIYMRELLIPKNAVVTGRIHKTEHLNILSQGMLTVWTEGGMKEVRASTTIRSLPGIKRVGYAHEDSVWITVHHNSTDERDIKKVEARLFADTFDEAYLASQRTIDDAIRYLGFTHEEMKAMSENESDQTSICLDGIRITDSLIHGLGIFPTRRIERGSLIAKARIGNFRTQMGRFCNHSAFPNAEMVMRENGDVDLISLTDIEVNEEILNDYYLSYTNTRPKILRKAG